MSRSGPLALATAFALTLALAGCSQRLAILEDTPAPTPSPRPAIPTPISANGALDEVPTSCWGLGPEDCLRVVKEVAPKLQRIDPPVTYIQVGAFGCDTGERCPRTLAARSQGDVIFEVAGGVIGFHVTASDGGEKLAIDRQDALWVQVRPTSSAPLFAGAQPFALGHCGLWSGIDLGGAWWHPVGVIDADHPDSINAAQGTITVHDPDHATFVSRGGLTVQVLRAPGPVSLPPCM
jgi:hypothetical protein